MTVNIDLLDKTLHHIETLEAFKGEGVKLDDRWEQASWGREIRNEQGNVCGTAACFAGWAVQLAGDKLVRNSCGYDCDCGFYAALTPEGDVTEISDRAEQLLGLNWRQRSTLFSSSNTLDDLRETVAQIKADELRALDAD